MKAIIGQKLGMTRIFDKTGKVIPVTLVIAKPNTITQIKTTEIDGYSAVQYAYPDDKKISKPQTGHLAKSKIKSRSLKEFSVEAGVSNIGDKVDLSQFEVGEKVIVSATSKGKGFAGTIKRHNFHLGPKTHGSHNYRQPGSIGSAYPQRVIKGKKMAGHMGHERVSTKNLDIINIDLENNILMIKGAVPGANKSMLEIRSVK